MKKTYIIGTGFLSSQLKKKIKNSIIYSAQDFIENINSINNEKHKINIVINTFYATKKLNYFSSYKLFTKKSIFEISTVLDLINPKIINKIIYTSSSSVYGSINNNINYLDDNNRSIYAGFKISSEFLIRNYCNKNLIPLSICRIFNLYGEKNEFSIIEKLKNAKKDNIKIKIYNRGLSLRDFIHVDDVVKIYKNILQCVSGSGLYDIGTGKGISINEVVSKLKLSKKNLIYKKKSINEIHDSIADNNEIKKKLKNIKFKKIENYLGIKTNLKFKLRSNKNFIEKNLNGSIIYGAGYSGIIIAKQMSSLIGENVSYFVDDDQKKIGTFIDNIEIISFKDLQKISNSVKFKNIIIAIPSLNIKKKSNLIRKIAPYCENISTLPEKNFFKNNQINFTEVSNISLDELFGKQTLKIDFPVIKRLKNSRILITGGAGSIGTEITRQICNSGAKQIIVLDHAELNIYRLNNLIQHPKLKLVLGDIKDKDLVNNLVHKYKIDYIFHAAAYKHVKYLEENIQSAVKNNVIGTWNLLQSIKGKKINFIFISTDKAVNPKNILGITKRVGELLVHSLFSKVEFKNSKFFILRFGNVIGSDGSALPLFLDQIKNDRTISLTHKNMSRYFMSIKEACNLVLQVSVSNYSNNTFFLDMGQPIKIIDIIKKMFKLYAKEDQKFKIKIVGNKFNEKINEQLTNRNIAKKTSIKKVFSIQDKIQKKEKFLNSLDKIIKKIDILNDNQLKIFLKKLITIK